MADPENRVARNVPGAWFVDTECIDCDLCRTTAPDNFRRSEEDGYSYVHHQPTDDEQRALCEQALEECPVEAIGYSEGAGAEQRPATSGADESR